MLDHALLLIGIFLLVAGVTLAALQRPAVVTVAILVLGVVCSLVGVPGLQAMVFKIGGQEATVTMQDLKTGADDVQVQLAANNQHIKTLSMSLDKQVELNTQISDRLSKLEQHSGLQAQPLQANVNLVPADTEKNNGYSVLVFYKDERRGDATAIKQKLLDAGYQSAAINTSLAETAVGPQPENSTYIVFTERGAPVADAIGDLVRQTLPPPRNAAITKGGPVALRRGDAQVFLY